jgi:hypothetical protein
MVLLPEALVPVFTGVLIEALVPAFTVVPTVAVVFWPEVGGTVITLT